MTTPRPYRRFALLLLIAATALFALHAGGLKLEALPPFRASAPSAPGEQSLSPNGQAMLHAMIQSPNLPELRWPNFSDYDQHVEKFYTADGFSLAWVKNMEPTSQAKQVIALLMQADQKGLTPDDYDGSRWTERLAKLKPATRQPSEADAVHFDLALTVSLMRYISDLHIGKVNPKHFDFGFDIESKKYDLPELLKDQVVGASDVSAALAQVEPPLPAYKRLIHALQTYLQLSKTYDGKPLPAVAKPIAPGDTYSGLPQMVRLLRVLGDLPVEAQVPADSTTYQGSVVDAVKNFQSRMGRDVNGRISKQTIDDLNVPLSKRVQQMQLTLERLRWLPTNFPAPPIVANIPEFHLRAYDDNFKVALTMNVVVGKAYGHGTPVFADMMEYVVFRPYWSVPYSITKNELVPHIVKDPDYLAKKNFEVVDARQEVVSSGTVTPEILAQIRAGKLFIREKPGDKNSLGLVKFIFPNNHNVYMHDTPAKQLFSQSRRDFSHGCIRLEKPADLAVWVLRNNPGWTRERILAAMNGTQTQQVNLAHPIPVLIVYGTVFVSEDGAVHFFDDIYKHDAELQTVLEKGYPYPG